jgi:hypothetical protein
MLRSVVRSWFGRITTKITWQRRVTIHFKTAPTAALVHLFVTSVFAVRVSVLHLKTLAKQTTV